MKARIAVLRAVALTVGAASLLWAAAMQAGAQNGDARAAHGALAQADPPTRSLSSADIASKLKESGYPHIHSMELEDGRYEVQARNRRGREVLLFVDPETGAVKLKTFGWVRLTGSYLAVRDAVARAREAGFTEVYAVEREHALYEIIARGKKGGLFKLFIHPRTGGLIRMGKSGKPLSNRVKAVDAAGPYVPIETVLAGIERAGMRDVYAVYPEHNMYEFIARDRNGELVIRHIDPKTGQIFDHSDRVR